MSSPSGKSLAPVTPFFFETDPPSPTATLSSPFFRLPLELRTNVYSIIFSETTFWFTEHRRYWILAKYCHSATPQEGLRETFLWTCACKTLLSEAFLEFYRHASCVRQPTLPKDLKEQTTLSPFRLLSLYRIRKIDLNERTVTKILFQKDEFNPAGHFVPHLRRSVSGILHLLKDRSHSVKDLKLKFDFHYPQSNIKDASAKLDPDFSMFFGLGSTFERVEFTILLPAIHEGSMHQISIFYQAYLRLQENLEALAMYLIGVKQGDESGWRGRDWQQTQGDFSTWFLEVRKRDGDLGKREVQGGLHCFKLFGREDRDTAVMVREPDEDVKCGTYGSVPFHSSSKNDGRRILEFDGKVFKARPTTPTPNKGPRIE